MIEQSRKKIPPIQKIWREHISMFLLKIFNCASIFGKYSISRFYCDWMGIYFFHVGCLQNQRGIDGQDGDDWLQLLVGLHHQFVG